MRVLIIPDYHATPGFDNRRAGYIGNYIADNRPDVIVCLGDFADLPSLNEAARRGEGNRAFEGSRYAKDLAANEDALERLHNPFARRSGYNPRLVMLGGNHEHFIERAIDLSPRLEGTISLDDLGYEDYGWRVYPFLKTFCLGGWAFCHFFPSGNMGRPISGKHIASSLVAKNHMSSVVGHNHLLDWHEETRPDGRKVIGISAGCITHPEDVGMWNRQTARNWWRGVILLDGLKEGGYRSVERMGLDALKRRYK